jgi:hypothetical protein
MFIRSLLAVALAAALSGCVSPLVRPDPPAWQPRAGDAVDWQNMARETVGAIPLASAGQSYNVYVESDGSRFGDTYKAYLEEALFARGFPVTHAPEQANIVIGYDAHLLPYQPGGKKRAGEYRGVGATALAGLGQFRNISSIDTGLAALMFTGGVADYVSALDGATDAEVVVVSKITSPQTANFHFVRSHTFYVRPEDLPLYAPPPPGYPVVPLRVSGR